MASKPAKKAARKVAKKAAARKATAKKAATKRTGRPTKRTPENVAAILAGLRKGTPLTVLCAKLGLCDDTVRNWAEADEALSRDIARAREAGEDWLAMEGLGIVDNVEEDPASRRVRSDYRLKVLAKFNPKRWGDKLQHADADGEKLAPPQFIVQPVAPRSE